MSRTNFETLLEAGCHFGHLKRKWNPAMAPYIFMERNGIHIIDLHKTVAKIDDAAEQVVVSGFRRYVGGCLMALQKKLLSRIITFSAFFILGVVLEFILYGVLNGQMEQMWLFKTIEVLATLFIWQFGGYIAFEFFGARKRIIRYKQVLDIKFNVKHWE